MDSLESYVSSVLKNAPSGKKGLKKAVIEQEIGKKATKLSSEHDVSNRIIGAEAIEGKSYTVNEKLNIAVKLTKESMKGCVEGHKVIISIIKEIGNRTFLGKVEKIIGHKNDPGVDILTIAAKHSIETEFSEEVKRELKNF